MKKKLICMVIILIAVCMLFTSCDEILAFLNSISGGNALSNTTWSYNTFGTDIATIYFDRSNFNLAISFIVNESITGTYSVSGDTVTFYSSEPSDDGKFTGTIVGESLTINIDGTKMTFVKKK